MTDSSNVTSGAGISAARCQGLTVPHLSASPNLTSYPSESAIYVNCEEGYILAGNRLLLCNNGKWEPDQPQCLLDKPESTSSAVIIAVCTVASVIALIIIIITAVMVTRNCRRERAAKQKQESFKTKILELSTEDFARTQDCVGMPALVFDNINSIMRGRTQASSMSTATTGTSTDTSQDGETSTGHDKVFIY